MYITTCLKTIANNLANGFGGQLINQDYTSILFAKEVHHDNRTESEIVEDIKTKLENMR